MTDIAWIDAAITSARPQAIAALLRYFRDLDTAEEAFQDACLRALKNWPKNGPPRDPAAWLDPRRPQRRRSTARAAGASRRRCRTKISSRISRTSRPSSSIASTTRDYRDDLLRLLFICCHPELPNTQQIALALRIVSGLSVKQIARAFLVSEAAMEQRITRAKARITKARRAVRNAGRGRSVPSVSRPSAR